MIKFRINILATDPNREEAPLDGPALTDPGDNAAVLSDKAARCRRLAAGVSDRQAADVLTAMARNYEEAAERLHRRG